MDLPSLRPAMHRSAKAQPWPAACWLRTLTVLWMAFQVCSATLLSNRSAEPARRCFPSGTGEFSVALGDRFTAAVVLFVMRLPASMPVPGKENLLLARGCNCPGLSLGLLLLRAPSPEGRDETSSEPSLDGSFRFGLADAEPADGFDKEPPPSEFDGRAFWFNTFE